MKFSDDDLTSKKGQESSIHFFIYPMIYVFIMIPCIIIVSILDFIISTIIDAYRFFKSLLKK